ncbi:MAG TPA: hypothetical protein VJT31_25370, partial [Rugosimonospora sp.]|nr:hypothetical protein [Rugosimonospora sp.]
PAPTLTLTDPMAPLVSPDPATTAEWRALDAASSRYAQRRAGQAARMLRELFPAAHRVVFDRDEDLVHGVQATLLTVRDSRGALLWHDPAIAEHPDALALAEAEAYGGPLRPHLDAATRQAIEALIEDADATGPHHFFPAVPDGPETDGDPVWQHRDLRELVVAGLLADLDRLDRDGGDPPGPHQRAVTELRALLRDWRHYDDTALVGLAEQVLAHYGCWDDDDHDAAVARRARHRAGVDPELCAYDGSNEPQKRALTGRERDILTRLLNDLLFALDRGGADAARVHQAVRIFGDQDVQTLTEIRFVIDPRTT